MSDQVCVVHHDDLDGRASAAVWRMACAPTKDRLTFVESDYNSPPTFEQLKGFQSVVVLDFSLPPDIWRKLHLAGIPGIWIDHHKTAIASAQAESIEPRGFRRIGRAACLLTWDWCFPNETVPAILELLGAYDIGDKSPRVLHIQYGMLTMNTEPTSSIWDRLLGKGACPLDHIETGGGFVWRFVQKQEEKQLQEGMFRAQLDGFPCICCNGQGSSGFFASLDAAAVRNAQLFVLFHQLSDGRWEHGFYTTPDSAADASTVAKAHGGGGHKGAARFTVDSPVVSPTKKG